MIENIIITPEQDKLINDLKKKGHSDNAIIEIYHGYKELYKFNLLDMSKILLGFCEVKFPHEYNLNDLYVNLNYHTLEKSKDKMCPIFIEKDDGYNTLSAELTIEEAKWMVEKLKVMIEALENNQGGR
jgi:hypothetical protein